MEKLFACLTITFIFICCIIAVIDIADGNEYKKGQIDALTGKIKYHLVVNSDSTKTWELIIK